MIDAYIILCLYRYLALSYCSVDLKQTPKSFDTQSTNFERKKKIESDIDASAKTVDRNKSDNFSKAITYITAS